MPVEKLLVKMLFFKAIELAKIAIITGVVLYSISQFILKPFVIGADNYPHFLHVMAVLFVLNVIIMLVIGKLYPREEAYEQHYTEDIDITPWSLVKPLGGVICAIVVGVYIYFS